MKKQKDILAKKEYSNGSLNIQKTVCFFVRVFVREILVISQIW